MNKTQEISIGLANKFSIAWTKSGGTSEMLNCVAEDESLRSELIEAVSEHLTFTQLFTRGPSAELTYIADFSAHVRLVMETQERHSPTFWVGYVDPSFERRVENLGLENVSSGAMACLILNKDSYFKNLESWVQGSCQLGHIWQMLNNQRNGQKGPLAVDETLNVFFVNLPDAQWTIMIKWQSQARWWEIKATRESPRPNHTWLNGTRFFRPKRS